MTIREYYGSQGENTVAQITKALAENSLDISFDSKSREFTILKSSDLSKETLEKIFGGGYQGWKPEVLDETDGLGNRKVKLIPIDNREFIPLLIELTNMYVFEFIPK